MKRLLLSAFVCISILQAQTTFNYTGAVQYYVVSPCIYSLNVQLKGAQGGNAVIGGATGGLGGTVTGTLAVTPGDTIWIYVGGQNGYNGGGQGGIDGNNAFGGPPVGTYGGWGGGASDIRVGGTSLANRAAVAGGGGGAGNNGVWPGCQVAGPGGNGGAGGGNIGGSGTFGVGTPCSCGGGGGDGGLGGSQVAGGLHGNYAGNTACLRANWAAGGDGTLGAGGTGSTIYYNGTGGSGGGGGGYYGGGAGGNGSDTTPGGGGGGGSSNTGTLTSATSTSGDNSGNGVVIITNGPAGTLPSNPGPITGAGSYCIGDTASLSIAPVSGATSYTWSFPSGTIAISGSTTTTVTAVVGNTSGYIFALANNVCGPGAADSAMLVVHLLPTINISTANDTICTGTQVTLLAGGAVNYSWSSGGNLASEIVTPTTNTTYTVTGTDANSCSNTSSIDIVVNPLPTVLADASQMVTCVGASNILLTGTPAGGTWSGPGVSGNTFTPSTAGTFNPVYSYTDNNGCANTDSVLITVNGCAGIQDLSGQLPATIYPNPSNGTFSISFNANLGDATILISDALGKVVYQSLESNVLKGEVKLVHLEKEKAGLYLVQISTKTLHNMQKITIGK